MADEGDPVPGASAWEEIRADLVQSVAAFVSSFRARDLGRVQVAFFAFALTEWGGLVALFVYAFQRGGMEAVGFVALLQQFPAAVVASLGSVFGDRYDRRRVLLLVFLSLSTVTLGAGIAMILDAPAPVAYLLAAGSGWVLTLVRPTYGALLPWVVRTPRELTTSYAASGLIESVSIFLGPMLVGTVLAAAEGHDVSGPGLAFLAMGSLLAIGTILVWTTRTSNRAVDDEPEDAFRLAELGAGYRYVFNDERRRLLVGLVGAGSLVLGVIDTLIVVLALDVLKAGDAGVGFLNAALGVGAVVGASVAMVAGQRARLLPSFRAGLTAAGTPLVVTAAAPVLAAPMLAVSGGGMQMLDVTGRMMLQRLVPDEKLSRTYGVLESLYMAMEGVGAFGASLAVVWIGSRWTLLAAGAFLPLIGLILRRRIASLDVGVRVPTEEMAILRATDLFAPLPPIALERLARNLVPTDVPAGTIVITEGDAGDRFFVIERGTDGRHQERRDAHRPRAWRLLRRGRLALRPTTERHGHGGHRPPPPGARARGVPPRGHGIPGGGKSSRAGRHRTVHLRSTERGLNDPPRRAASSVRGPAPGDQRLLPSPHALVVAVHDRRVAVAGARCGERRRRVRLPPGSAVPPPPA